MYQCLAENSKKYLNKPALFFEGKRFSYNELLASIRSVAMALSQFGVKHGDNVSIISPNMPQAVFAFYGLNYIGATANMIHPLLSSDEIKRLIIHSESKLVFVLDSFYEKLQQIEWGDFPAPTIVLIDIADAISSGKKIIYRLVNKRVKAVGARALTWTEFLSAAKDLESAPYNMGAEEIAAIMYSGGTTGTPKGVMLSNKNFNALALQSYDTMGIKDVVGLQTYAVLPIFHGTGLGVCIHSMLYHGFQVYLVPKFDARKSARLIIKNKIEFMFGVPALYEAILRTPEVEKYGMGFMRVLGSCGDKLSDRTRKKINDYLDRSGSDATITNGYGMTECTAGCCYEPYFGKKPGTSGIMCPDMKAIIVEPGTERELCTGEVGELCISGPTVMKGYYKNPEATAAVLKTHSDGNIWLHSGDAFSIDDEGYLTYVQRLDRMFVSAGFNIYPSEIEQVIAEIPEVDRCVVVGKRNNVIGSTIVAYVTCCQGVNGLDEKIKSYCREKLAEYSIPQVIKVIDDFPKTSIGKIDYKKLETM